MTRIDSNQPQKRRRVRFKGSKRESKKMSKRFKKKFKASKAI